MSKNEKMTREEGLQLLSEQSTYKFAGHTFRLLMTHRVILEWERVSDLSYFADLGKVLDRPTLTALSAMLYCLLVNAGYRGTRDAVVEHMASPDSFKDGFQAVLAAYAASKVKETDGDALIAHPQEPTLIV
jgi:hypothetical protein